MQPFAERTHDKMKEVLKDQVFDDMTKHRVSAFDGLDPKFVNYLQKNVENVNFKDMYPKWQTSGKNSMSKDEKTLSFMNVVLVFKSL